ncbi:MAG: hypothetical protein HFI93_02210 [Lachnospiraceae bacterium]|nr:hypothetical protein [Lachnospiraceae bacterium]
MGTKERIRAEYHYAEWSFAQRLLFHLGVNWTYRGFGSALEAAILAKRDESLKSCMKIVYIDVAKKNKTDKENVRRDITTLIRVIWENGNREFLAELAGKNLEERPTCQEFIWILANHIGKREKQPEWNGFTEMSE